MFASIWIETVGILIWDTAIQVRGMKKSGWLVVALLVLVLLGVVTGIAMNVYFKDKLVQGITVQIVDEGGKPIPANLIINELTDEGPKKIWSGSGPGIVSTSLRPVKKSGGF